MYTFIDILILVFKNVCYLLQQNLFYYCKYCAVSSNVLKIVFFIFSCLLSVNGVKNGANLPKKKVKESISKDNKNNKLKRR